jgi:ABC-2 type transport system permease protein
MTTPTHAIHTEGLSKAAALAFALVPVRERGDRIRARHGRVPLGQLFGALLGAPKWRVDVTPFAHVGLVRQSFRAGPAAVMLVLAALAGVTAIGVLHRRELTGA